MLSLLFGGAERPRWAIAALCVERRGASRMANLASPVLALRAAAENAARTQPLDPAARSEPNRMFHKFPRAKRQAERRDTGPWRRAPNQRGEQRR